jgi:uncharacterized membrane protein YbhN (UPF0104 family)
LDAVTLWILAQSLGGKSSVASVFASFMIANLFRSISFISGGLGTFEAAVVYTLKTAGSTYATGPTAALVFCGIPFFCRWHPGCRFRID